mgnify:CR=1 FL=1
MSIIDVEILLFIFSPGFITCFLVRKDYTRNLKNIELLADILQTKAKSSLGCLRLVEGIYKERMVWCKIFIGRGSPHVQNPNLKVIYRLNLPHWQCGCLFIYA